MAKISNTLSYPNQSPIEGADYLIGTAANSTPIDRQTKTFTLQGIAEFVIDEAFDGCSYRLPIFTAPTSGEESFKLVNSLFYQDTATTDSKDPCETPVGSIVYLDDGSGIGSLIVAENVTIGKQTIASGLVNVNGGIYFASEVYDASNTVGTGEQVLVSQTDGTVEWQNYQGSGLEFQGAWNADTNTPDLQAISLIPDNTGKYWIVSVEGTTPLNTQGGGTITDWEVGDWAIISEDLNDNIFWDKIDNSSVLTGQGTPGNLAIWVTDSELGDAPVKAGVGTNSLIYNELTSNLADGEAANAMGTGTSASGQYSTAIGNGTQAIGIGSTAMGTETTASGDHSTSMGELTTASGDTSTAMGRTTVASGTYSTALGFETDATGDFSTAMGGYTEASGTSSTAMGQNTTASGNASTAMGDATTASGDYSTAMGYLTEATGDFSTAMGESTEASGLNSTAIGSQTTASGNQSTAMGYLTEATGQFSTAIGNQTLASGVNSTAIGRDTEASGDQSFASGNQTLASGDNSTALGLNTEASGLYSTVSGNNSTASGSGSVAMGQSATASGVLSTAFGNATEASALGSTAMGQSSEASGTSSTAMGLSTEASGNGSVAMGANTTASGNYSTALNNTTIASGSASFASGLSTEASGQSSTAMGSQTTASGNQSTAIGNQSTASGVDSSSFGKGNISSGNGSVTIGSSQEASAENSISIGGQPNTASGILSVSIGSVNESSGSLSYILGTGNLTESPESTLIGISNTAFLSSQRSTGIGLDNSLTGSFAYAFGSGLQVTDFRQTVLGSFNSIVGPGSVDSWNTTDNLFIIGNGTNPGFESNALELRKDGELKLNTYGAGQVAGTAAYNLSVDANGRVIETPDTVTPTFIMTGLINNLGSQTQGYDFMEWTSNVSPASQIPLWRTPLPLKLKLVTWVWMGSSPLSVPNGAQIGFTIGTIADGLSSTIGNYNPLNLSGDIFTLDQSDNNTYVAGQADVSSFGITINQFANTAVVGVETGTVGPNDGELAICLYFEESIAGANSTMTYNIENNIIGPAAGYTLIGDLDGATDTGMGGVSPYNFDTGLSLNPGYSLTGPFTSTNPSGTIPAGGGIANGVLTGEIQQDQQIGQITLTVVNNIVGPAAGYTLSGDLDGATTTGPTGTSWTLTTQVSANPGYTFTSGGNDVVSFGFYPVGAGTTTNTLTGEIVADPPGPGETTVCDFIWTDENSTEVLTSGADIPIATDNTEFYAQHNAGLPVAAYYNFDPNNSSRGLLYNQFAARVIQAPTGFRLPTQPEWNLIANSPCNPSTPNQNRYGANPGTWVGLTDTSELGDADFNLNGYGYASLSSPTVFFFGDTQDEFLWTSSISPIGDQGNMLKSFSVSPSNNFLIQSSDNINANSRAAYIRFLKDV
tara:strand:+ start:12861 stop:17054 length:4194 start_codon:yes stop_codon:yes gene_type:complete